MASGVKPLSSRRMACHKPYGSAWLQRIEGDMAMTVLDRVGFKKTGTFA
jgi:hypothetical protein